MSGKSSAPRHTLSSIGATLTLILLSAASMHAERLPLTSYTVAQGLASDDVSAALEDAQGFLWIGTNKGLSRFDGREIRSFGQERGLSKASVTSMVMARDGTIWAGVWGGVFRFDPARGGSFAEIPIEGRRRPTEGTLLTIDPAGRIWMAFDGLYKSSSTSNGVPVLRRVELGDNVSLPFVSAVFADRDGVVWAGYKQLYRIMPGGRVIPVGLDRPAPPDFEITSFAQDVDGRIWAGTSRGLWRTDNCEAARQERSCVLRLVAPVSTIRWNSLVARRGGGVWMGTADGLIEIDATGAQLRRITPSQGLHNGLSLPLLIDRAGDLWINAGGSGLQRLAADGFTSFAPADGLVAPSVQSIVKSRTGDIVVVGSPHVLQRFDGRRFIATRPATPQWIAGAGWSSYQADMEDRGGDWWIPTDGALIRFAAVRSVDQLAAARPRAIYSREGCFRGASLFRLYEDSRGDIWVGKIARDQETLARWIRASGTFECHASASILGQAVSPTAFLDDGRGTLWIGFYLGQVVRYRNGRFQCVLDCDARESQGSIHALFLDRRERLWIATGRSGVIRVDDPQAERPTAHRLTIAEGLASNGTGVITQDRFGRVYMTTDRGVDVIEESTGRIRHYGFDEGVPRSLLTSVLTDSDGDIWFGGVNGVARFTPKAHHTEAAPPCVLIDGVRVSGRPVLVAAVGQTHVDNVVVAADERNVQVDFVGLPRQSSAGFKFQYRLSERDPWSQPTSSRSIVVAGLSPGHHRLEIRALDGSAPSSRTAVVALRVLTPFYRSAWFLMLMVAAAAAFVLAAYRTRIARTLALERQRTRIAMDLHDEMGSRLGSIGLLADLAADETVDEQRRMRLLNEIAETAAGLGLSLTDIVWSLRRGQMTMESLARHLAGHGRRLFPGNHPAFEPRFPDTWPVIELSLSAGRNALLVGLEALHNAAQHARPGRVVLELRPEGRHWRLMVSDDGQGFDHGVVPGGGGFGLETMRRRAAEIGATLDVHSSAGHGTSVALLFNPKAEDRRLPTTKIRKIWNVV